MDFVNHISNHNLERRYLGMITDESESAPLEEHLLACPACVEPAESTQDYMGCSSRSPGRHSGRLKTRSHPAARVLCTL
jgi:hypothetical protein